VVSELNKQAIREHIIESLGWVRDAERVSVDRDIDEHGGDLRIDSRKARPSASSSRMPAASETWSMRRISIPRNGPAAHR